MDSIRMPADAGRAGGRIAAEPSGRLLLVSPEFPAPLDRGFRIRVHYLAAELARHGHRVVLLAAVPAGQPIPSSSLVEAGVDLRTVRVPAGRPSRARRALDVARGRSAGWFERRNLVLRREVERLAAEEVFDVVQVEIPELADVRLPQRTRLVLDAHNVWSELIARGIPFEPSAVRRLYRTVEHARYRRAEQAAWRRSARCLVTSAREADIVHAGTERVPAVIPNGVDVERYRPIEGIAGNTVPRLAFTGLLRYGPNADAVAHMVRDILPLIWRERPETEFEVVGEGASSRLRALGNERVRFVGAVPDVRPLVGRAHVVVVPLRVGSGTRLKILEAMALARPIVTTAVGAEGISAVDGEHLLLADHPAAFAAAVLRVLDDAALARSLGDRARRLVEASYAWTVIGDGLHRTYRELLGERPS